MKIFAEGTESVLKEQKGCPDFSNCAFNKSSVYFKNKIENLDVKIQNLSDLHFHAKNLENSHSK